MGARQERRNMDQFDRRKISSFVLICEVSLVERTRCTYGTRALLQVVVIPLIHIRYEYNAEQGKHCLSSKNSRASCV